jgi:integrase
VAALTSGHVQQRDGRWCIVDLVGKHGRVRTVPMPTWSKVAIDAWTSAAGIADGHLFHVVNRGGEAQAAALNEKVVWQLLQGYAARPGHCPIVPAYSPSGGKGIFSVAYRNRWLRTAVQLVWMLLD